MKDRGRAGRRFIMANRRTVSSHRIRMGISMVAIMDLHQGTTMGSHLMTIIIRNRTWITGIHREGPEVSGHTGIRHRWR